MHFVKTLLYLATLLGFVMAQTMQFLSPTAGSTLTPGQNFTIELKVADSLTNFDIGAVVIGLQSCSSTCAPPSEVMGTILYQGSFPSGQLTANFSVMVPSSFSSGTALIGAINLYMVGLALQPSFQFFNQTVTIS
ncbi:hypothetical protein F5J12DRAFT_229784 [Pisolithus orientalis]|uniref:uncharacterized protein n=1 Tax=Pisolithus orientalis TaxID=936130 RepID=UPI002224B1A5|nr:uncharacterized protein F5J12DRAFT_229784 [Pisolithus orientalis]KAI6002325.1 hypothetical protein F5J12DRAFT_229784 [Pisolithus orientalis]